VTSSRRREMVCLMIIAGRQLQLVDVYGTCLKVERDCRRLQAAT